ncbi:LCP family protein [Nocardioides astragali]|uniref:LCP family protein n=1 Tax=Nocardioides astragali TaxID=1776736 RepID=A0ABW2N5G7_9ACTN|nr:LCP family protein [Nocardioides astragali]
MSEESRPEPPVGAPKRKGKAPRKHTVGRVILISAVVLALVTGLGTVYFIRHLNGNITGVSLAELGDERPEKLYKGNGQPLNILVMGSDSRDCDGCGIDQEGGGGSDTTILVHLSADRSRAYAVSIPRDSIVDRPEVGCDAAAETDVMWNAAYTVGGPVCTVAQLQENADLPVDHFVVVDFNGFGDMVDAVGGVPVCVPEDIDDPAHAIFVPKGDPSVLSGDQALDYVRARYVGELAQQNDISRIRRQQTFIAALVRRVKSAGTLTRFDKVVNFLDAATKSLTTDTELDSVTRIGKIAMQLQSIGLDNIKFVTLPTEYYSRDSEHWGKVFWKPEAAQIWKLINEDKELPARLIGSSSISAEPPASSQESQTPTTPPGSESPSETASESPSETASESPSETASESETAPPETPEAPATTEPEPVPGVCA